MNDSHNFNSHFTYLVDNMQNLRNFLLLFNKLFRRLALILYRTAAYMIIF